MTKTRPTRKQRAKAARLAPWDVAPDPRDLPGRATVLSNVELLCLIFQYLPPKMLLSKVQGTCHQWQKIIENLPQTYLNAVPLKLPFQRRPVNHILRQNFSHMLRRCDKEEKYRLSQPYHGPPASFEYIAEIIRYTPTPLKKGREYEAMAEPTASWRRMHLASPPIRTLNYTRASGSMPQTVTVDAGIRMGQFYNFVVGILTEAAEDGYYLPEFSWPWDDATQPRDVVQVHCTFVDFAALDITSERRALEISNHTLKYHTPALLGLVGPDAPLLVNS